MASGTLLLNSTYEPLQVISWQRAIGLLWRGKVEVVRTYQRMLRAVSWRVKKPAVVRLVSYVRRHRSRVAFSRRNILVRDDYRCQYCAIQLPASELTCDHVVPRSKGGPSAWDNLVAACVPCNRRKANRTPEQARMKLRKAPVRPDYLPALTFAVSIETAPSQWREFLN